MAGMLELARQTEVSSLHVTFPTEAEWRQLGEAGFLLRTGLQYHWENRGYETFDDFLASLAARKRKAIKKERRRVAESGVGLRALTGGEIAPRHWALNLVGDGTLYGRNWGGVGHVKFLHFEACYYQAIDYAIRHRLGRVEAGAQGEHKIQRGYLPSPTYSAHWIRDPAFRRAVADFLERERRAVDQERNILESFAPSQKDGG